MSKKFIVITSALLALAIVLCFSFGFHYAMEEKAELEEAEEQLAQQQQKNRALQEENALLHDDIWILNQQLMKQGDE